MTVLYSGTSFLGVIVQSINTNITRAEFAGPLPHRLGSGSVCWEWSSLWRLQWFLSACKEEAVLHVFSQIDRSVKTTLKIRCLPESFVADLQYGLSHFFRWFQLFHPLHVRILKKETIRNTYAVQSSSISVSIITLMCVIQYILGVNLRMYTIILPDVQSQQYYLHPGCHYINTRMHSMAETSRLAAGAPPR